MRLRHIAIPGITTYTHGEQLQQHLVRRLLAHKANPAAATTPPPDPTVLTLQFAPVYTAGRREADTVSPEQEAHLRAGGRAEFHYAPRGGQTTFHGPGQLVAYPVLDLRRHGLSPRGYVCALERAGAATCVRHGVAAARPGRENVGVWVSEEAKIAAVGVHLRRNVTSHGVGLNVGMEPLWWFGRIVACGLEGKRATSLEAEGAKGVTVEAVGRSFVEELAKQLGVDEVVDGTEEDVMAV